MVFWRLLGPSMIDGDEEQELGDDFQIGGELSWGFLNTIQIFPT
jgi:hypothetical protein